VNKCIQNNGEVSLTGESQSNPRKPIKVHFACNKSDLFEKILKLYSIFSNVWGVLFQNYFAYLKAPFLCSENNKIVQNITDVHNKV